MDRLVKQQLRFLINIIGRFMRTLAGGSKPVSGGNKAGKERCHIVL